MNIHDRIMQTTAEHLEKTGISPNNIYLGREEMKELLFWAEHSGYIDSANTAKIEGALRPEVAEIPIYEVNSNFHLRCSV